MTREEAIEVLKLVDENVSCDDCLYYAQMEDCPTDEDCIIVQANRMAIQALSQEPTVTSTDEPMTMVYPTIVCDDAVSRKAVIEAVSEGCQEWRGLYGRCEELINALPSVTQKSGKWIEDAKTYYEELNKRGLGVDEYTPYFTDDIACSECLAKYNIIDNETQFFKHCPNCGAKMESEVNNG